MTTIPVVAVIRDVAAASFMTRYASHDMLRAALIILHIYFVCIAVSLSLCYDNEWPLQQNSF